MRQMVKGKPVQISHANLHRNTMTVHLHPENHKKVMKAKRAKKGVRLQLSHQELHASGILDFFRNIGSKIADGANWIKNNIIDSQPYQAVVKPIATELVNKVANPLIDEFVPQPLRGVAHDAVGAVGKATNAYGGRLKQFSKVQAMSVAPASEFRPLINPSLLPSFETPHHLPKGAGLRHHNKKNKKRHHKGPFGGSFNLAS